MSYGEFLLYLNDGNNFRNIVITSLLVFGLYLVIYRRYILSPFDPLFFAVLAGALANSTILYLFYDGVIRAQYFYSFMLTEVSFLAGFFMIRPINPKAQSRIAERKHWSDSPVFTDLLYFWCSGIHMFLQLLTYALVGLPILMESRMTAFAGGSGFGMVGRFLEVASGAGIILLFYRIFYTRQKGWGKAYDYGYLVLVFFFMIVSGSKTNFLFLIYYLFLLSICMNRLLGKKALKVSRKITRTQSIIFLFTIPFIFLVIYIQYVNTVGNSENLDAAASLRSE